MVCLAYGELNRLITGTGKWLLDRICARGYDGVVGDADILLIVLINWIGYDVGSHTEAVIFADSSSILSKRTYAPLRPRSSSRRRLMMEDSMVAATATVTKMSWINLKNMIDTVADERNSIGGWYGRVSVHGRYSSIYMCVFFDEAKLNSIYMLRKY